MGGIIRNILMGEEFWKCSPLKKFISVLET